MSHLNGKIMKAGCPIRQSCLKINKENRENHDGKSKKRGAIKRNQGTGSFLLRWIFE
jgi:hypothetical protein